MYHFLFTAVQYYIASLLGLLATLLIIKRDQNGSVDHLGWVLMSAISKQNAPQEGGGGCEPAMSTSITKYASEIFTGEFFT